MRTLASYEPITSMVLHWITKETKFRCRPKLGEILQENKRLVVAISHSSPLSWLPAVCLLNAHVCARGGGQRRPLGVMDRAFFHIPGIDKIAQLLTQTERPLAAHELIEHFELFENMDLVVFPEGSNCFFGRPDELQDFRSPKFVEIAVRVGAPILICVHRGSEPWATTVPIEEPIVDRLGFLPKFATDFLEERLRKKGQLAIPLWPKKIEKFSMLCELYRPELNAEDLSQDKMERREQLRQESDKIHARMQELLNELDGADAGESLSQSGVYDSKQIEMTQDDAELASK